MYGAFSRQAAVELRLLVQPRRPLDSLKGSGRPLQLVEEVPRLQEVAHAESNLLAVEGFDQEVVRAQKQSAVAGDVPVVRGQDYHWKKTQAGPSAAEAAEKLQAIRIRHVEIQKHNVRLELDEGQFGRLRVGDAAELVGGVGEVLLQQLDVGGLVVDDQDSLAHRRQSLNPPAPAIDRASRNSID